MAIMAMRMQRRYFFICLRVILFDCLGHDLDTAECEPDGRDESWLVDMSSIESDHQDTSDRDEDRLAYTRMDGREMYISSIVDFFDKK